MSAGDAVRVVDLGALKRDRRGRFVKTFTLSYETRTRALEVVKVVRHLPAEGVELVGKVAGKAADRGLVWNIQVLDGTGADVTFDFACFQEG
ncbi:hypothetical protein AB0M95_27665 [Sphaerisporangium sp. NPDC051017]|uniref:hypothetical protein n=1 Tax=Sphaerisporangium sp. NPDC051017 TaxID=3154636 RepID=UPI0034250CD3